MTPFHKGASRLLMQLFVQYIAKLISLGESDLVVCSVLASGAGSLAELFRNVSL